MTAAVYRSVFRPDLFDGRVVLVTGGGSGIGRCISHELAHLGAQVVIVGRTESKLADVAAEIEADGGKCSYTTCDIRDPEQIDAALSLVIEQHGRLDGLVNNAGGQFPAALQDISPNGFEAVIRNNLLGTFNVMRAAFAAWMGEHGGAIVNITADHRSGFPGMSHTGAARAGVANLTMTSAIEWGPFGIRVNEIAPGVIATSGLDTYDEPMKELIRGFADGLPVGRLGTEAEVSAAVCFLLSPAAAFITGAQVRIDGGALGAHRSWHIAAPHEKIAPFDAFHRAELPQLFNEG